MKSRPGPARRPSLALVLAVVALVAAACTGRSDTPAAVALQPVEVDGISFGVPDQWTALEGDDRMIDARLVEYAARAPDEDEIPPQVGLVRAAGEDDRASLDGYFEVAYRLNAFTSEQGIEVVEEEDVEVDGAVAARRLRLSVEDPRSDEPVRLAALVVEFPDRVIYDLRYTAPGDEYDEDVAAAVLDSFTAEPAAWEPYQRDDGSAA